MKRRYLQIGNYNCRWLPSKFYPSHQFRIWATNTLKEFITKGFLLEDDRLKQGKNFGKDYFDDFTGVRSFYIRIGQRLCLCRTPKADDNRWRRFSFRPAFLSPKFKTIGSYRIKVG